VLNEIYKNIVIDGTTEDLKIRGYKTPISSENLSNEIDDKTIETLLKTIRKNTSVFSEYFKLKWKINQKKGKKYEFSRYHIYAPYPVKITEKFDFEKSKKIMLELFKGFSEEFYKAANEIIEKKHVHAYPKINKRSGAFCMSLHNKETPFIMLNHTGTLNDLFTLVHEFGHGVHNCLSREQNNLSYEASLPIAETASIFSEMMLADKIMKEAKDDNEKIATIIKLLDDQFATIIRQTYFVLFEIFAHDNIEKGLTKEEMNQEYKKILKEQFGKMKIPPLFEEEWHYIPHIHYSPFYCYSYAWGNLLVLSLFSMYKKEGENFKEKYLSILKAGGSKSPVEMLKEIGIDPTKEEFWQQGFEIIKEEIKELKKLAK
jgi:oligoendopeptidase F